MKNTGIIRDLDALGRIVIPKSLRTTLGIKEGDSIEIYTEEDMIVLKKHAVSCACGEREKSKLVASGNHILCRTCLHALVAAGEAS